MSEGDEALRNALVAHAESLEVMRFSGITKRIAMERVRPCQETDELSKKIVSKRSFSTWMKENGGHMFIVF